MFSKTLFLFFILGILACPVRAQSYTSWIVGNATDVTTTHEAGLLLAGGGTDNNDAMKWFLQRAQGGDVVVIRASGSNGYNSYLFSELGVTVHSVETLLIPSKNAALDSYVATQIRNAEALFIAGGDQYQYYQYWKDTPVEDAINYLLQTKKAVVGGTSAGMMILGGAYYAPQNSGVITSEALPNPYHANMNILAQNDFVAAPYLQNTVLDTHFDQRTRGGRQVAFMARMETDWEVNARGIACNEQTAVAVDGAGKASVFGKNSTDIAYFFQTNGEFPASAPETCISGQPLLWQKAGKAVKAYKIQGNATASSYLDLTDWRTGVGGSWENWTVQNNILTKTPTTDLPALPAGALFLKQNTQVIAPQSSFSMDIAVINQIFPTKTFTIKNTGEKPLEIQTPTSDSPHFIVQSAFVPQTLPAGGTANFTLKYEPQTVSAHEGTITLSPTFSFKVIGATLATALEADKWWRERVKLYPNPADSVVSLDFQNLQGKTVYLTLRDRQGKTLQTLETKESLTLPTQTLPAGAYLVHLQAGKHKIVLPLIKK